MNKKHLTISIVFSFLFAITLIKLSPRQQDGQVLGLRFDYNKTGRCVQMGGHCSNACSKSDKNNRCVFGYFLGCFPQRYCILPVGNENPPTPTKSHVKPTIHPTIPATDGFVSCQAIANLQQKYCSTQPEPTDTPSPIPTPILMPTNTPKPTSLPRSCTPENSVRCILHLSNPHSGYLQTCRSGTWQYQSECPFGCAESETECAPSPSPTTTPIPTPTPYNYPTSPAP